MKPKVQAVRVLAESARVVFLASLLAVPFVTAKLAPAGVARPQGLEPLTIPHVVIEDEFWSPKLKVWREVTIPDCFAKFEKDGALENFDRVRDGASGNHAGPPWYDGLVYEMIRASADFLAAKRDPALEARIDGYIERIGAAAARDPDGYVNTWTQLERPTQRWGLNGGDDNWQHDVYNAGALVDAAVHYYRATGKAALLRIATRLANHMCDVMGPPPKKNVVPGHALAEEAFVKLCVLFREKPELKSEMPVPIDEERYLRLAEFWIENRGNHEGRKSFGPYGQDHLPVLEQETIEGHAVRATLLCAGLTAAARVNRREDYARAAERLWENMVSRRMHVTGGVGAFSDGERFGPDYQLPNDAYLETCAAVGAAFFHHNRYLLTGDARSADELERALYNGVLAGVSLKGDSYFYTNPLEAGRDRARWSWHGCPCCPPMFLKIVGALPGYIYATSPQGIFVNLFISSRASCRAGGVPVALRQMTSYPWDGAVRLRVDPESPAEFDLRLRIPGWCERFTLKVNGETANDPRRISGYVLLSRQWTRGDEVELSLEMPARRWKAHPKVETNLGRVALLRGPLVYCVEGQDSSSRPASLVLPPEAQLSIERRPDLLGGVTVIRASAKAARRVDWGRSLYLPAERAGNLVDAEFVAIPYYANANRGPDEMRVWLAEDPSRATPLPPPTIASRAIPSASHGNPGDTVNALNDQIEPDGSADESIPRFTWWDHRGTAEWVQYDFGKPTSVWGVEVYWWDERRIGRHCRVPASWRVLYRNGTEWKPVRGASGYGTEIDRWNEVRFEPVETTGLRLEVQLQPEWSGGILEWKVTGAEASEERASAGDPIRAAAPRPRRKLIEVGWDMPDTRFLREHHKEMEATTPFDGVVFRVVAKSPSGEVCDTNVAWDARPWKREWFEPALEDLRACAFEKFTENFIHLNATPGSLDWFDDAGWAALEEKVRILAWLAREGGAKGICLDPESYGERQFQFRASRGRTFAETAAAARRRGAQFLRALAEEHPSATLLSFWLGSLNLAAGRSRDPEAILAASAYGLFAPFVDGLCDALRPGITLVDGCEHGYYMDSAEAYLRAFYDMRSWEGAALLSPENRAKYLAQGQAGFGFYLDMFLNPPGHSYSFPDDGIPRLRRLERNLRFALAASDGYVWVYGEQCRWWPLEDPDPERKRLPHTVGKGRLWEEAMPGIRRAIEWARDPRSAALAEIARRRSRGALENLLENPTFDPGKVQGNGLPAGWSAWQAEGSRGTFSLDPGVGRSAPGAAKASGVRDGCLLAKSRARPGERYAVEARATTRAGAIPSVRVRWQTEEGSWTQERLDVVSIFEPDPAGSAWRWAFEAVEVPEGAGFLVLLLIVKSPALGESSEQASEASGTPAAWFDDVGLYSLD